MKRRTILILVAAVVGVVGLAGAGIAVATGGGSDEHISGPARDRIAKVALDEVGSGVVTDIERDEDTGLYEAEVTLADGTEVDVLIDEQLRVVAVDDDRDDPDDDRDHPDDVRDDDRDDVRGFDD